MTTELRKTNRGGARAGAGRKATGRIKQFATTAISGSPQEIAALKSLAAERGTSLSRLVIDTLLQSNS